VSDSYDRSTGMSSTSRRRFRRQAQAALRLAAGRLKGGGGADRGGGLATPGVTASGERTAPGLPFDGEQFESRLVWMLGSPRTGSTWLLRLLIHPWILARGSPTGMRAPLSIRGRGRPNVLPIDESYLLHHLTPPRSLPDTDRQPPTQEFVINGPRRGDPGYFFSDAYADVWSPEVRRLVLVRLHAQADRAAREHSLSDPLVLIKEPNGSQGAELLMSLLPRSRMIFLLRDGRDVIDSMLDARSGWVRGSMDLRDPEERLAYVRRQARLWLNNTNAVQSAYDARPAGLRWMVRYEDLRYETAKTLRPLLDWLDIERSESELRDSVEANAFESLPGVLKGPTTPRRAASPGLWLENMSAAEQEAMRAIIGTKLDELGYASP
jgi:Sulfotransferase family